MKATGIVRRIDDLGRVVIPKEIRRTLRIREGDPLEIFVDRDGEVILKKYSPIGELGDFAREYADSLAEATGKIAIITDRDSVIAVSGGLKKELLEKRISSDIEKIMEDRKPILITKEEEEAYCKVCITEDEAGCIFTSEVIAPIVAEGDPIGTVIICARESDELIGEIELKLTQTAAGFLAKQMEQ